MKQDFAKLAATYRELLDAAAVAVTASGRPVLARTLKARFGELVDDWLAATRVIVAFDGEPVGALKPITDAALVRAGFMPSPPGGNDLAELKPGVGTAPLAVPPVLIADAEIATLAGKIEPLAPEPARTLRDVPPAPKPEPVEAVLKPRGRRG